MATPIIPRLVRGRLYFQTADVLFPTLKGAMCAHAACEAHRLNVGGQIDVLIAKRIEALAELRRAGDELRRSRRQGGES